MYDDIAMAGKIRFTDTIMSRITGDVFVVFSHDPMPWIVVNDVIRKSTWIPPLCYPTKTFALEAIVHSKAGVTMPPPLPVSTIMPKFDEPGMIMNETKAGFVRSYLIWKNAMMEVDSDEVYGVCLVFSFSSPTIGIGDIYMRNFNSKDLEYTFKVSHYFNESVPLIDALAEFIVKKDDEPEDGGVI